MPDSTPIQVKKPLFATLSFSCLLLALPVGWLAIYLFAPKEDYLGYGGLGVALVGFMLTLAAGTISGMVSLLRREKPRLLAGLGLTGNAAGLIWVLINRP